MKTTLAKKLLFIPVAFGLMALSTGCTASPISTFTGEAVVKSHAISGKNCRANVQLPDGKSGAVTVGKKTVCNGYKDGIKIKIENGKYKGKA
jgi:hypothetical protein